MDVFCYIKCNITKGYIMHIYEKNDLKMTSVHVVYNAGALYESKGREGTMHLMEQEFTI